MSTAGDVNGDGIDDLIIGADRAAPNGIFGSGQSYIVFGIIANTAPVAEDDAVDASEDMPVTIHVLANDSDPENDDLGVTDTSTPADGSVVINPDNTVT